MIQVNLKVIGFLCGNSLLRGIGILLLFVPLMLHASENLLENSPFLPPGFGEEKTEETEKDTQPTGPLAEMIEFRSVVRIDDQWLFSLYNKEEKRSLWVSLNEDDSHYRVTQFDPDENRLHLTFNERTEWLPLKVIAQQAAPVKQESKTPVMRAPGVQNNRNSQFSRPALNRRRVSPREPVQVPRRKQSGN